MSKLEKWSALPSWLNLSKYQVSTFGRIKSIAKNYILTASAIAGYKCITLSTDRGTIKQYKLHRLIALTFVDGRSEERDIVDHIDRNPSNNKVENLRWVNAVENMANITRKKHSNGRKVAQLDLNGNLIKEWPCVAEAARQLKIDKHGISNVCLGKPKQKTAGGFLWMYVEEKVAEPETWVEISDDLWISDTGRLYYPYGKRYTRGTNTPSYYVTCFEGRKCYVHELIAEYFVMNDDPDRKTTINHIDGNKKNNHADNLEWCTRQENSRHAVDTGLLKPKKTAYNGMAREVGFFKDDVLIKKFPSQKLAAEYAGVSRDTMKKWMKLTDTCSYRYIDGKESKKGQSKKKRVNHYNKNGDLIATYESLMDAVRTTKYSRTGIQQKTKLEGFPHNDNFRYAD